MKSVKIQAFLLAVIIMMSCAVGSFSLLNDSLDMFELVENSGEGEQNEEEKSGEEEIEESFKEYVLINQVHSFTELSKNKMYLLEVLNTIGYCQDVPTLPPELA